MAGIEGMLQVGQTVELRELEFGYQLALLTNGQPGQTVVEIGVDHITFDNAAAGITTRVPLHLIKKVNAAVEIVHPESQVA